VHVLERQDIQESERSGPGGPLSPRPGLQMAGALLCLGAGIHRALVLAEPGHYGGLVGKYEALVLAEGRPGEAESGLHLQSHP
jgi:hypothetical protein